MILLGNLSGAAASAPDAGNELAAAHSGVAKTADAGDIHVARAKGANARTVVEIVTKGVVRTDKDFGAGYSYKVLIEEATLQQ